VSRGYLLFEPDIPYKEGYPGESAMNAVIPGILSLVEEGFVDRDRIGVQGHSWGGYQIAYMVTRTNLFAAAEAGAPVSEHDERLRRDPLGERPGAPDAVRARAVPHRGDPLGGAAPLHRELPLFTAYKVETPLLMLHNDEDGAVPWEEGIQFFVALRRLESPVWLVNYNGRGARPERSHNQRDWAIRMQQFFDHYLVGAPPPVWMVDGVPAVAKGRTLGLELVQPVVDNGAGGGGGGEGGGG
jgi:dipeptidyl aminopeptidase/acylaminoacyl peptidase